MEIKYSTLYGMFLYIRRISHIHENLQKYWIIIILNLTKVCEGKVFLVNLWLNFIIYFVKSNKRHRYQKISKLHAILNKVCTGYISQILYA